MPWSQQWDSHPPHSRRQNNNSVKKLTKAVTLEGVVEHLEAFQAIADANGGDRAAGRDGYAASVDYVVDQLEAAGYTPEVQEFEFDYFEENSELIRVSPDPRRSSDGTDFLRNELRQRQSPREPQHGHGSSSSRTSSSRAATRPRQRQHQRL